MSVILFSKRDVYQKMANAYEDLKHLLIHTCGIDDERFYKSLRRLYFANVATYLCQYHDNSPLSENELKSIDVFQELEGIKNPSKSNVEHLHDFISAWNHLTYNLITNDGEVYEAKEAKKYIEMILEHWVTKVIESLVNNE